MADDHDDGNRPDYDPQHPDVPSREPPLRSTAPQSEYTTSQVGFGIVVLVTGLTITFAIPILL
jgi:hypothetical protein